MPRRRTPGPTIPIQVLAISCWTSPWFHAKPGDTHGLAPHDGVPAWKKKSGLPNIVNDGVRRARPAREGVALVEGEDEQRIRRVDPVALQAREERGEGVVVGLQLGG